LEAPVVSAARAFVPMATVWLTFSAALDSVEFPIAMLVPKTFGEAPPKAETPIATLVRNPAVPLPAFVPMIVFDAAVVEALNAVEPRIVFDPPVVSS